MATTEAIIAEWKRVYRTNETAFNPSTPLHKPKLSEIRPLIDLIMGAVVAAAGGIILRDSWTDLSAVTGTVVGQLAIVPVTDAGTHTDPVVGGTVANAGEYAWSASPAGWQWIRAEPELDIEIVSAGAPSSGNAIGADAAGKMDYSWLPTLLMILQDIGMYFHAGDGIRALLGIADDNKGTIVGPWPNKINDLAMRPDAMPKVYLMGDSRCAQNVADTLYATRARGWLWWQGFLTGWPFDFQPSQNFAVGGTASYEAVAQALDLIEEEPGWVFCITSTNDRAEDLTAYQSTKQMENIQRLVTIVGGHRLVWFSEWPRGDGNGGSQSAGFTGSDLNYHLDTAQWVRQQAGVKGVSVIDHWPVLVNRASATLKMKDTITYDGLHPTTNGGYVIGSENVPFIEQNFTPISRLPVSRYDTYSSENQRGLLIPDAMFDGTSGTVGANCTGTVATGWTAVAGASMTCACSIVTDADGIRWQQFVVTGTPSGLHDNGPPLVYDDCSVVLSHPLTIGNFLEGDILEAVCAVECDASTGLRGFPIQIKLNDGTDDYYVVGGEPEMASIGSFPNSTMPNVALAGVNLTPQIAVPASLASGEVRFLVAARNGEAINATVRVSQFGVRKVVS